MKKILALAFLFLNMVEPGLAQTLTKKVLFLGNSYTASNNLPQMVAELAGSTGDLLSYDANTPGGHRMMGHASNPTSLQKIRANNWDYVVLQAQSQEPSWATQQVEAEVLPYAAQLSDSIRANNLCSEPMFFMTWGRESGDAMNCPIIPWVCTYEGMDSALYANYMRMAMENDATVSPVGAVWRKLRQETSIQLYSSDGSHPSYAGSYAAACTFYARIFGKDPRLANWEGQLDPMVADTIRKAAYEVVFDTITWEFTLNRAVADFTYTVNDFDLSVDASSSVSDSLLWSISDGTTYSDSVISHVFPDTGSYTVQLVAWKCGKADTLTQSIRVESTGGSTGISSYALRSVQVYPNPVSDRIRLSGITGNVNIKVFSMLGAELMVLNATPQGDLELPLEHLPSGFYTIALRNAAGDLVTIPFVKE
jgi:hypothetical protein